jgi:uncharacterized membrane protein
MSKVIIGTPYRFMASLGLSIAVSVGLLAARVIASDSTRYAFLLWNIVLATVPLLLGWLLVQRIRELGWLRWQQIALTIIWLAFLPNSFYLVTDFVHLRQTYEASLLFDVVLLSSFMCNGFILGFISVYMVHRELVKRLSDIQAYALVGLIFVACSFAAYLGRFTRWNTWDLVLRPAGLLFDVSDRFVNPGAHTDTYVATLVLFLLLMSTYTVIYEAARALRKQ